MHIKYLLLRPQVLDDSSLCYTCRLGLPDSTELSALGPNTATVEEETTSLLIRLTKSVSLSSLRLCQNRPLEGVGFDEISV